MKLLTALFLISVAGAFAQQAPRIYANDGSGRYLGNLSANPIDPNSTSNPIGIYGSTISPYSINNPIGIYGSSISPYSARNPLATSAPVIIAPPAYPSLPTLPRLSTYPSLNRCCSDWSW
jgi:hypothetical protein